MYVYLNIKRLRKKRNGNQPSRIYILINLYNYKK